MDERIAELARALREEHGLAAAELRAVVSPYRVCPMGAHLDHQHGPVLGAAITAWTRLVFAPSRDASMRLSSANFPGELGFRVDAVEPPAPGPRDWGYYARGAAWALGSRLPQRPRGIVGRLEGSLPGGGLSSSASVLLAYLEALAAVNDVELEPAERVALGRRAENEYVGLASGILDFASIVGAERGHLLLIDTLRSRWDSLPLGPGATRCCWLVAFSGTTRNLAETGFNRLVDECRQAAAGLAERAGLPRAERLGDVPEAAFREHADSLPPELRARGVHFFGESERVRRGAELWRHGDLEGFGRLMNESYRSSVENFPTHSPELVRLQEILEPMPGVLGARFSGAGFGGCTVALVAADGAESARDAAREAYARSFPELADRARFLLVDGEDAVRLLPAL